MKVRCIRAPEKGIPIKEGQIYTVKYSFDKAPSYVEDVIEEFENMPGYALEEVQGYYFANRFEVIDE